MAACQDGTGPVPTQEVETVEVTPVERVFTTLGETGQFSVRPADSDGVRVEGAAVSWRSSAPGVVRIDGSGLATAVADGIATVIAEVDGVIGEAAVAVCTAPVQLALAPGEVRAGHPSCPVLLPAGEAGDRYRVAIVRLSPAVAATAPIATLEMTAPGVATSPPPALRAPVAKRELDPDQVAILERAAAMARARQAIHLRLRAEEERLLRWILPLPPEIPRARAQRAGPRAAAAPKRTFLVRSPSQTSCSATQPTVTGVLVAETAEIAVYQDSAQAASLTAVTPAQVQQLLDFYTDHGKPVIESAFGSVPDRDGNGQVVILVTPEVGDITAAFVWGGDLLTKSVCNASNEMELVYFNAVVIRRLAQGDYQVLDVLVHEIKHIVSFNQRLQGSIFSLPPAWVEEGGAEIAGEKASRHAWAAAGGPGENEMVTAQSFPGKRFTPENFGIAVRIFNTITYLATQPNSVVYAPTATGRYTIYGSGWHFHRFLGDAYGGAGSTPNADASFFRQQTSASTPAGLDGLPVLTGKSFADLIVEYAAAVMLNGTGAPAPTRGFATYDLPSAATVLASSNGAPAGRYPYPVTGTASNPVESFQTGSWPGAIGNGGLRIHDFVSNGTGSGAEIEVQVEGPARVVVARIQ